MKNETKPYFSVIICTHNRLNLLKKALKSLIDQSEQSWEAIVVDDGSHDGTSAYIYELMKNNPKIKYFHHENHGQGFSKQVGIEKSVGKYVTFLDSDDEYLPKHLESRKAILTALPEIDLLHGSCKVIGYPFIPDIKDFTKKIKIDDCAVGGTFFIKRRAALKLGFKNLRFGDDTDFFSRAVKAGLNIVKTELQTYQYNRTEPDSLCNLFSNLIKEDKWQDPPKQSPKPKFQKKKGSYK